MIRLSPLSPVSLSLNREPFRFSNPLTVSAPAPPVHAEPRPGEIRHSFADISKAARLLRYAPLGSFRDGLAETVLWYKGKSKDAQKTQHS